MDDIQIYLRNFVLGHTPVFDSFAPGLIILFAILVVFAFAIVFFSPPSSHPQEEREPEPDLERQPLLQDQGSPR